MYARSIGTNNWHDTGEETEPDEKNRVSLGAAVRTLPGVRYKVKQNDLGQILLDPVKLIPASEAWFHNDSKRAALFNLSVSQAEAGQLVSVDLGPGEDEQSPFELKPSALLGPRPRYTLAELLAASDYSHPQPIEELDWVEAPAVGRELT
jgi:hypothetical protein